MIENLFINILEISITSAAAIAVILIFSNFAENHFRKKWRYWVWVFLAAYLIIPMKTDFPNAPIKIEIPPHEMIITEVETFVPEANPYMDANGGLSTENSGETGFEHGTENSGEGLSTEDPAENTANTAPRIFVYPIVYVGAVIWAVGAALVFGWNVAMYVRFSTRSKPWNREVSDEDVLSLFEEIKTEMGVPKRVRLYENRLIKSPMMVGFFNPRVLLPAEELLPEEYEFVLRHELTHYKRGDIWYKFLMMLAASVHWFNPMVGTMCRYAENDIEITCDEAVVKAMEGDRRQEYCATILNIMRRGQNSPLLLSTSFYGGAKVLKKRFSAVLEPRTHRGIVLFIIAALVVLISGTMVACGTEGSIPQAVVPEKQEEVIKPEDMVVAPVGKTEDEIISGAKTAAMAAYYEINTGSENDISVLASEAVEKYIDELSEGKQKYIAENGIDIAEESYTVTAELLSVTETESGAEILLTVSESYEWTKNPSEGYKKTGEKSHVRFTYNSEEEVFTDFVIYGITWMDADYFVTMPSEIDPRPAVSGPDENGLFPIISNADWDRWVTYNGISDLFAPEDEIPSILECSDYLEYLEEKYPEIDDWKLDYERNYYELTYCYDPYTYSFRSIYMPRRFAVLETEQSEEFDMLIVFSYEEYAAGYVEGGIEPRFERQFRTVETFAEYTDSDMREAVFTESDFVLPHSLWFPTEKKMIWFNTNGDKAEVYVIKGINKALNIYSGGKIFEGTDLSGEALSAPEGREKDLFLFIDLEEGTAREKMTVAYYDYETKTVDIYENCVAGENEVFPQVYFLDSNTLIISADGVISFYRTYAHSIMTETFAEIGGNGKGLSEGEVSSISFISIDKTKGGRYMFIYKDEQTKEYSLCTFNAKGEILSDFSLGLDSEGTIGSASYKSGIAYFSYYPDYSESTKGYNYAVDARPGKNHELQANAW